MSRQVVHVKDMRPELREKLRLAIIAYFEEVFIDPLKNIVAPDAPQHFNGVEEWLPIAEALDLGRIHAQVVDNRLIVSGSYSSAISRALRALGAKLVGTVWKLPYNNNIPIPLRAFIAAYLQKVKDRQEEVVAWVKSILSNIKSPTGATFKAVELEIFGSVEGHFPEEYRLKEYRPTTDFDKRVVEDVLEQVKEKSIELLEDLENATTPEQVERAINAKSDELVRKASTLAEYHVNRVVIEAVEDMAKRMGSKQYVWVTCEDDRVRPSHEALHNRVFNWDAPPVVDLPTGRRCHPGEDFGCRCWALPIIRRVSKYES